MKYKTEGNENSYLKFIKKINERGTLNNLLNNKKNPLNANAGMNKKKGITHQEIPRLLDKKIVNNKLPERTSLLYKPIRRPPHGIKGNTFINKFFNQNSNANSNFNEENSNFNWENNLDYLNNKEESQNCIIKPKTNLENIVDDSFKITSLVKQRDSELNLNNNNNLHSSLLFFNLNTQSNFSKVFSEKNNCSRECNSNSNTFKYTKKYLSLKKMIPFKVKNIYSTRVNKMTDKEINKALEECNKKIIFYLK